MMCDNKWLIDWFICLFVDWLNHTYLKSDGRICPSDRNKMASSVSTFWRVFKFDYKHRMIVDQTKTHLWLQVLTSDSSSTHRYFDLKCESRSTQWFFALITTGVWLTGTLSWWMPWVQLTATLSKTKFHSLDVSLTHRYFVQLWVPQPRC